jgi:WD40 repeat protein
LVAVCLRPTLYLWHESDSTLLELPSTDHANVTCVRFSPNGQQVATGQGNSHALIYDIATQKQVWGHQGNRRRIASIAWMNQHCFAVGSRDGPIVLYDSRTKSATDTLVGHGEEVADCVRHLLIEWSGQVCGLRWSPSLSQLASGGNDNRVLIWDPKRLAKPFLCIKDFKAAVKALAWNPTRPSLLATGAGTADRHIRFYNTQTGTCLQAVNTEAQVSSIEWSHDGRELISAHGFSQNQLIVWEYHAHARFVGRSTP